ncbi:DUF1761 domain-containing protein [Candidatus Parcubacteria bacterium]|uniref:DUF1761 domain-containing protein n=1 Tax=Candidatus Kaiserbacteria bacterium CG10_big_fil_rev_8_21_14_0_10_47_16 TaxID=1974608 RepID=A0A2H0UEH1_9BACT|nr:DUF1761 domain-containing protein [Candidatus Parcubacteria bacterium]PIR84791.1 MAG: hypothetical protein COU16_01230 [Candidatus Kaiserbacteria bacterium CG10_big_fil_rev_8_21_14_0_10_47_16]
MEIHYIAILACGVLAMVLGALWYGPIFGKMWMKVIGATEMDVEKRKEMQRKALPLYGVQFLLVLFQVYILAHFVKGWVNATGVETSLWIFFGFIMPTLAAASMWNNDSAKISWARFLIQGGYQLVLFICFGLILGLWG